MCACVLFSVFPLSREIYQQEHNKFYTCRNIFNTHSIGGRVRNHCIRILLAKSINDLDTAFSCSRSAMIWIEIGRQRGKLLVNKMRLFMPISRAMCAKQCVHILPRIYDENKFDRYATHYLVLFHAWSVWGLVFKSLLKFPGKIFLYKYLKLLF